MQLFLVLLTFLIVWMMLMFVGINLLTGCESWDQPNCVSLFELVWS